VRIKHRYFRTIVTLFCLWMSVPSPAAPIHSSDISAMLEPLALSAQDRRFSTALLFDFSPFTAEDQAIVQGFADPLGTGVDSGLRLFAGKVYFMDLLGNFTAFKLADTAEIELPTGALHGINLLDDLNSMYLSYDGRAFDKSLFDLQTAEVIERNGLPVTSETSPLSLSGYGYVSDNFNPFNLHWTSCPSRDKRKRSIAESIEHGRAPCSAPGACVCYGN
jgi:hypothetical protein